MIFLEIDRGRHLATASFVAVTFWFAFVPISAIGQTSESEGLLGYPVEIEKACQLTEGPNPQSAKLGRIAGTVHASGLESFGDNVVLKVEKEGVSGYIQSGKCRLSVDRLGLFLHLLEKFDGTEIVDAEIGGPDSPIRFSAVTQVEGVAAKELFSRGREWIAVNFRDANEVLQVRDGETGELIGRATMGFASPRLVSAGINGKIWVTLRLQVRDGRFKWEMFDFTHEGSATDLGLILSGETCSSSRQVKYYAKHECPRLQDTIGVNVILWFTSLLQHMMEPEEEW